MVIVCNSRQRVELMALVGPKFDYTVLGTPMVPDKRADPTNVRFRR
jgi:hypothetical protein